jgi:hypothetical protein
MHSDYSNDEANGSNYSNERLSDPEKRRHERKSNDGKKSIDWSEVFKYEVQYK